MKIKLNFFKKIFFYSIGIVILTLMTGYFLNFLFLDQFYIYKTEERMKEILQVVQNNIDNKDFLNEYIETLKERDAIAVLFLDSKQQEIGIHGSGKGNRRNSGKIGIASGELKENIFTVLKHTQTPGRILVYNNKLKDGNWISMRASLTGIDTYQHELHIFNIMTSIVTLLLAAIFGRIFSKKITLDIEKLNRSAHDIADLKFVENIGIYREDEIGELSTNIEIMSKKLKISIEGMKSFVSNASHELKTPIAVIATQAQLLLKNTIDDENKKRKYYETILRTSNEMNDLVTNLLTISKINSIDYALKKEKIDISYMVQEALEKYDFLELDNDIQVKVQIENSFIQGDKKLLKLVIDNLVLNALKYTPYQGKFNISREGNIFIFKNDIKEKLNIDTKKIWDPFYRGEGRKEAEIEGTGLGLSIVKNALELNSFSYGIDISESEFSIWFQV